MIEVTSSSEADVPWFFFGRDCATEDDDGARGPGFGEVEHVRKQAGALGPTRQRRWLSHIPLRYHHHNLTALTTPHALERP